MIEIIERKMSGGDSNEHIAEVKYLDADVKQGVATREEMVAWLKRSDSNRAVVYSSDRKNWSWVGVVERPNLPDYIRTYADSNWNDNLLALPEYV